MSEISLDQFAREVQEAREQILTSCDHFRNRLQGLVSSLPLPSVLQTLEAEQGNKWWSIWEWVRYGRAWSRDYERDGTGIYKTFETFNRGGVRFSASIQKRPAEQYSLRVTTDITDITPCLSGEIHKDFKGEGIKELYEQVHGRFIATERYQEFRRRSQALLDFWGSPNVEWIGG